MVSVSFVIDQRWIAWRKEVVVSDLLFVWLGLEGQYGVCIYRSGSLVVPQILS